MPLTDRGRRVAIEELPVELIRTVLAAIPDVRSLLSVVMSCPLFYLSFIDAESIITPLVLRNQIDHTVLPEALAALDSMALLQVPIPDRGGGWQPGTRPRALKSRDTSCCPALLRHTLILGRLHEHVRYFTGMFVAHCLSMDPLTNVSKPTTHKERCRIERAFYRFHMLGVYFRQPLARQAWAYAYTYPGVDAFLEQFAPWELEELSCIYHFLSRELLGAFNDVAEHDVEWGGSLRIEFIESVHQDRLQILLSTGLQDIRKMIQADTYEERYALVKPAAINSFPPIRRTLGAALRRRREPLLFLQGVEKQGHSVSIKWEVFADGDTGPYDVWRWAFSGGGGERYRQQGPQRAWGYVFWDKDRLEASGIFEKPWQVTRPVVSAEEQEKADLQLWRTAISHKLRKRIYDKGGRGWWDWGDETRLKWKLFGKKDYKYHVGLAFTPTREPGSIEEAKEWWAMVREARDKLDPTYVEPPSPYYLDTDDDL